jgi:hypothetical protein
VRTEQEDKISISRLENEPKPQIESVGALILDSLVSRTIRNKGCGYDSQM